MSVFFLVQPLFGYLKEKLEVATRVYFDEKDFSRTGILEVLCLYPRGEDSHIRDVDSCCLPVRVVNHCMCHVVCCGQDWIDLP